MTRRFKTKKRVEARIFAAQKLKEKDRIETRQKIDALDIELLDAYDDDEEAELERLHELGRCQDRAWNFYIHALEWVLGK